MPTTTTTTTALPAIYLQIASTYDGATGLTIELTASSALPDTLDVSFDWCTDSGADGNVAFSLPATFSGATTALANLSATGSFIGTYATGNVVTSSATTVTEMYVKGATLVVTTADTTRIYYISYLNVDNACASPAPVEDDCVKNCL